MKANEGIPPWVWQRRLMTATKVRKILYPNKIELRKVCPICKGSKDTKVCSVEHDRWVNRRRVEDVLQWTYACIIGHFIGKGRLTYLEVKRVAQALAPRLIEYPDFHHTKNDEPYRLAFQNALIQYEKDLGLDERRNRKREFLLTLQAGRRRMIARQALEESRCPLCAAPLPCHECGFGLVKREGAVFVEIE